MFFKKQRKADYDVSRSQFQLRVCEDEMYRLRFINGRLRKILRDIRPVDIAIQSVSRRIVRNEQCTNDKEYAELVRAFASLVEARGSYQIKE